VEGGGGKGNTGRKDPSIGHCFDRGTGSARNQPVGTRGTSPGGEKMKSTNDSSPEWSQQRRGGFDHARRKCTLTKRDSKHARTSFGRLQKSAQKSTNPPRGKKGRSVKSGGGTEKSLTSGSGSFWGHLIDCAHLTRRLFVVFEKSPESKRRHLPYWYVFLAVAADFHVPSN